MIEPDAKADALYDALYRRDYGDIRRIIDENPYLLANKEHMGYLYIAASKGSVELVKYLLSLGCDPNGKSITGSPVLVAAIAEGNVDVVRLLLEGGADPRIDEERGRRLIAAINAPQKELEMIKILEKYGVDIHKTYKNELKGGEFNVLSQAIERGKQDVVDYLHSRGVRLLEGGQAHATASENEVVDYFSKQFGRPRKQSLIEVVPTAPVSIAVHVIPSSPGHPYITLFTSGMSSKPMRVPKGQEAFRFAELFMQLPAKWKWDRIDDLKYAWPLTWIRKAAQNPHLNKTWLGGPLCIISNDEPPQPLGPDTELTCLLLLAENEFTRKDGKTICLYRIVPIYTEERDLEKKEGSAALLNALDSSDVSFVYSPGRTNVGLRK